MNPFKLTPSVACCAVLAACATTVEPEQGVVYENVPENKLATAYEPTEDDVIPAVYTVKKGDTVAKIARRYGLSYRDIGRRNNLYKYRIYPNQKLMLK